MADPDRRITVTSRKLHQLNALARNLLTGSDRHHDLRELFIRFQIAVRPDDLIERKAARDQGSRAPFTTPAR